ncbi:MAG: MmcQ/YjbR family DNA-binding protein [Bacteroidales bacterium]|nr:MmcQ/YjbR family DNA-binding protein [Bacteroidales bacterium]
MNIESFRECCLKLPFVTEDMPFGPDVLTFRLKGKIFACVGLDKPDLVVLKCDPTMATELRERYEGIEGAFHWNKKYWNQIWLCRDVDDELIISLIEHAWKEVNKKLPRKEQIQ